MIKDLSQYNEIAKKLNIFLLTYDYKNADVIDMFNDFVKSASIILPSNEVATMLELLQEVKKLSFDDILTDAECSLLPTLD